MNRAILLVLLGLVLPASLAQAQSPGRITGVVRDAAGDPVVGANVLVEGTTRGAAADVDGRYAIVGVPAGTYTLVATALGYRRTTASVTLAAGGEATQDFTLPEDALGLDEVVVTGQGAPIERRRLSTQVEVISPEQIEQVPATRLDQVLQAQLPNSQVRFSSGQPGTASLIRSRGVTSASSSSTPVIYVDGVRVDNLNANSALGFDTGGAQSSALPDIPLENIERIEFVKGGAATTLFGSDAANGVIQIFTRRGATGRANLGVEAELGAVEGTTDYLRYGRTADALFRTGLYQSYRVSAEGGQGDFSYAVSGRASQDEGFRYGNNDVRYDLRTTVAARASGIARYTGSFGFTSNRYTRDFNANTSFGQFGNLEQAQYGVLDSLSDDEFADLTRQVRSSVDLLDLTYDVKRFQTSQNLAFVFTPNLNGRLTAGLDYRVSSDQLLQSNAYLIAIGAEEVGTRDQATLNNTDRRFLGLTLEGNVQHNARAGDFSFVTVGGGQFFRNEDRQSANSATNVFEGSGTINQGQDQTAQDFASTVANYGVYVNENLGFKDRYFVEGGLRVDGNTAFGGEAGTQVYPRVGAAYTLSEEPFFKTSVPQSVVSSAKLRASYGVAGNFPQNVFAAQRTVALNPYLGTVSVTAGNPGDPNLRPEKVHTFEVGADFGLFRDRLSLEATYYNARTEDALFSAPFAPSNGENNQIRNIGTIRNRGFELTANSFLVDRDDFDLRLNASFNTLSNEVVSTGGAPEFAVGGFTFLGSFVSEGQPVGFLRGNRPFYSAGGTLDSVAVNASLGSPLPDYFGNLSLNGRYRAFTFGVTADYQLGAQGVNVDEVLRFFNGAQDGRIPAEVERQALETGEVSFFDLAGSWVENTDYLKLRLISLGYELPRRFLPGLARSASLTFAVTNPLNFVSSQFDPEVTGAGVAEQGSASNVNVGGFGFGTESSPRQYVFTLRVGL